MARRRTRRENVQRFRVEPPGGLGLDMETDALLVDPRALVRSEHCRGAGGSLERRRGAHKIARGTDPLGSWTFGADTKYAKITTASQLLVPVGGFALPFCGTAVRPSAGNTAYLLATRVTGKTYGPFTITLDENGILTAEWRKESDESAVSIATTTAIAAGADVFGLIVYDPLTSGGTTHLYVGGAEAGTAVTSVGAAEQPMQDAVDWYVGAEFDPSAAGITANTHFDGKVSTLCLLTLVGTRPADGDPTLLATLLKWSLSRYPSPSDDKVLCCYDFSEGTGTELTDHSRYVNHGLLVGGPSATAKVAYGHAMVNLIDRYQSNTGQRYNLFAAGGNMHYEVVKDA